jgi:hypothetical protein
MSGYLQRLVRNVMQPTKSSIRPLVGSMFSPAEYRQAPDSLSLEEHVEVAAQLLQPAEPSEESLSTLNIPVRRTGQTSDDRPQAKPVLPTTLPRTEPPQLLQPVPPEQITAHLPQGAQQIKDSREHTPQQTRTFTPMMGERPVSINPAEDSFNGSGTRHAAAPTRQEMHVSRSAGGEPDGIQIHIGRIEVTAVQQMPERAAIRPTRKGQSLEEYLNRRDRRA